MAYGISATGANNTFQLNSTLTSTVHFALINQGTTTGSNGQIAGFSAGDLIVGRPTSGSGGFGASMGSSPPTLNVAGTYKVFRPMTNSTATNLNGSAYGIQVKNASNNVIFDSRSFANGFGIKKIFAKNALAGGYNYYGAVPTGNIVHTSTSSTDYNSTYVSLNASYWGGTSAAFNAYYFDSSTGTGRILFSSFIDFGGFLGLGTIPISNFSEILVGDFI